MVARQADEVALDASSLWRLPRPAPRSRTAALIYTDRSVYRPQQAIHWKVVGYRLDEEGEGVVLPEREVQVDLLDANHQVVLSELVESNSFGTAAGVFEIPAGRLLGQWHLRSSLGGQTAVRVEEYKRPTFEVEIAEPAQALRLNRRAELEGVARYYFGLPVVEGEVSWQVERVPVFPRWWFWGRPDANPEVVAAGTAATDAEGSFRLAFQPDADERLAESSELSFRFRLRVDVTDDGGETRSAGTGVSSRIRGGAGPVRERFGFLSPRQACGPVCTPDRSRRISARRRRSVATAQAGGAGSDPPARRTTLEPSTRRAVRDHPGRSAQAAMGLRLQSRADHEDVEHWRATSYWSRGS